MLFYHLQAIVLSCSTIVHINLTAIIQPLIAVIPHIKNLLFFFSIMSLCTHFLTSLFHQSYDRATLCFFVLFCSRSKLHMAAALYHYSGKTEKKAFLKGILKSFVVMWRHNLAAETSSSVLSVSAFLSPHYFFPFLYLQALNLKQSENIKSIWCLFSHHGTLWCTDQIWLGLQVNRFYSWG